jgi:chromate reductase
MTKVKIFGMAGSLRKDSYNKALLRAAGEMMSDGVDFEIFDISPLPLYNNDLLENMPDSARELKAKIKAADAILIATPEYNYSFSGVLKNAIDWASRPMTDNSFEEKPVAIMSASPGMLGGARAQYHLRQVLVALNTKTLNRPEIMINFADKKFDETGKLTDEETQRRVKELVEKLTAAAGHEVPPPGGK